MNTKMIGNRIYIAVFILILLIPGVSVNNNEGALSVTENRPLAYRPILLPDGSGVNPNFTTDFDHYIDDRLGFRDEMVAINAWIQYYVFHRMENQEKYMLGPHGEFNNIEGDTIIEYQHLNLYKKKKLYKIANSYQQISDALNSHDIQFYYMQCWSRETIYPEFFPDSVCQYGEISSTEQVIRTLQTETDINLIPLLDDLRGMKKTMDVYTPWGDPVHWSERGAYEVNILVRRSRLSGVARATCPD